jgi:xanthine/CO dehydrogenase XdhC/CoxF family maturation factor
VKEFQEIVKAYDLAMHAGKSVALASVVHLDGSSYRRPGARMLVSDEGELTGAISGGCLEGDALRKAMHAIAQKSNRLVTYDTSDEDDMSIGIQLGCAGVIQVLFESINPNQSANPIQLIRKALAIRQHAVLLTLFDLSDKKNVQPGTCLLMEADGHVSGSQPYPEIQEMLLDEMRQVLHSGKSGFHQFKKDEFSITAFVEYLQPPVSLVVVGAGNDAIPMMQFADTLGWDVRVVDGRNTHARPERFTSACQVLVSKPEQVLEQLPMDERTVFVMMTHNYNYDLTMLKALLTCNTPYIGMLGPRKKLERMLDELRGGGMVITEEMIGKVYGPSGLEIGAETPEEIAMSIIAEIQGVLTGTKGGQLKLKQDVIHARSATQITEKKINPA